MDFVLCLNFFSIDFTIELFELFDWHRFDSKLDVLQKYKNGITLNISGIPKYFLNWITFYCILIIQLKRFHIQYTTEADKNEAFVAFPLDFFNPYKNQALINAVPSLDSVENDLTHLYECYAVINHYGSLHGGHYTAYVRVKG